jgi:hypothetical protein
MYAEQDKPGSAPGSSYAILGATTRLGVWPRRTPLTASGSPGSRQFLTAEKARTRIEAWDGRQFRPATSGIVKAKTEGLSRRPFLFVSPVSDKKKGSSAEPFRPER